MHSLIVRLAIGCLLLFAGANLMAQDGTPGKLWHWLENGRKWQDTDFTLPSDRFSGQYLLEMKPGLRYVFATASTSTTGDYASISVYEYDPQGEFGAKGALRYTVKGKQQTFHGGGTNRASLCTTVLETKRKEVERVFISLGGYSEMRLIAREYPFETEP